MLLKTGLIAYLCLIPFLFLIVGYLAVNNPGFFIHRKMISALAEARARKSFLAGSLIFLFGFLSLYLALGIHRLLGNDPLVTAGTIFLGLTGVFTILVALFPRDRFRQLHGHFGTIMLLSKVMALVILINVFTHSPLVPPSIIILNLLVAFFALMHTSFIGIAKIHPKFRFLTRLAALHQWLMAGFTLIWDFLVGLIVIRALF
jgi:hypothetical protein